MSASLSTQSHIGHNDESSSSRSPLGFDRDRADSFTITYREGPIGEEVEPSPFAVMDSNLSSTSRTVTVSGAGTSREVTNNLSLSGEEDAIVNGQSRREQSMSMSSQSMIEMQADKDRESCNDQADIDNAQVRVNVNGETHLIDLKEVALTWHVRFTDDGRRRSLTSPPPLYDFYERSLREDPGVINSSDGALFRVKTI